MNLAFHPVIHDGHPRSKRPKPATRKSVVCSRRLRFLFILPPKFEIYSLIKISINKVVEAARRPKGATLVQMAQALDVTTAMTLKGEHGNVSVQLALMNALAKATGIPGSNFLQPQQISPKCLSLRQETVF